MSARSISRPDTPNDVRRDRVELDPGVLEDLLHPLQLRGPRSWTSRLR